MPNTPLHALPYPTQTAATAGPDVPNDIKLLADAVEPKLTPFSEGAGTPAALGIAAGKPGRRHRDTTTGDIWLDISSAWVIESPRAAGEGIDISGATISVKRLASNDSGLGVSGGSLYVITDETTVERPAGGALRIKDGGVTGAKIAAALKPSGGAAAAAEALRALGTTAGTAAAGNDSRLSEGVAAAATVRTLGAGATQAAAGNDPRFPAGADITHDDVASANKDGATFTPSMRTLGAGAQQATAGNDARLSDMRTPSNASVSYLKLVTMPRVRVAGTQNIGVASFDPFTFTAEQLDNANMWNPASPTAMFASVSGVYYVWAFVSWGQSGNRHRRVDIYRNGAGVISQVTSAPNDGFGTTPFTGQTLGIPIDMQAGDYIQILPNHGEGGAVQATITAGAHFLCPL